MKRIAPNIACFTRSKKPRLSQPLKPFRRLKKTWVAATHIYNYISKDPLVDWLKLRNRQRTTNKPCYTSSPRSSQGSSQGFEEFIKTQGTQFESKLVSYISKNKIAVVTVSDSFNDAGCQETIRLMKQGIPILHSAPVKHTDNTGGIIDLLVRSDYVEHLVDVCPITEFEKTIMAPKLGCNYHYVVIDVKFSTLPLRSNGRLLLNSNGYPAYKAQTWIYTHAVGEIQGYTSDYAFILGRRWNYMSKGIRHTNYSCLDKLGVIDFKGVDKCYVDLTKKAVKWVRDVQSNGNDWTTNPPTRIELYPNMCVDSGIWNQDKQKIAEELGDITSIWNCGVKHRKTAMSNGVNNWKDHNCHSSTLGITGKRAIVIDKIMEINRQTVCKMLPKVVTNNLFDWKSKRSEVFVDFETLSDIFTDFSDLPNQKPISMIFMIGVGYENNGKWEHTQFIADSPTHESEYKIMNEFRSFITKMGDPKMFYWHADRTFWRSAERRQLEISNKKIDTELTNWADLSIIFKVEPIVVKDCFKFGLKSIAKSMKNHGMITEHIDSTCDSGMAAQVNAWDSYSNSKNPRDCTIMQDIAKYNEFDCKVLWDILSYLRKNHV